MIIEPKAMRVQVRPNMKGGRGEVTVRHLVETEKLPNIRYVGEMTLPAGTSIGEHTHDNETEYYIITEGLGVVAEKDGEHEVGPGHVVVTGDGASHSICNTGQEPLKIIAFIVTE